MTTINNTHTHEILALLIDADNIGYSRLPVIMQQASLIGDVRIKMVFGNFRNKALFKWRYAAIEQGFVEYHQTKYSSGKNMADIALMVEAMDIVYSNPEITGICIVTNDSDYMPLINCLKKKLIKIYGFGEYNAATVYQSSCDRFYDLCSVKLLNSTEFAEQLSILRPQIITLNTDIFSSVEGSNVFKQRKNRRNMLLNLVQQVFIDLLTLPKRYVVVTLGKVKRSITAQYQKTFRTASWH